MSRPVDIRVRAKRDIWTSDGDLVEAGTEGIIKTLRPLSVEFGLGYSDTATMGTVERELVAKDIDRADVAVIAVYDRGEGGES